MVLREIQQCFASCQKILYGQLGALKNAGEASAKRDEDGCKTKPAGPYLHAQQ